MSCRYLENVLSRQDNSKAILRCLEDVLCQLGNMNKEQEYIETELKKRKKISQNDDNELFLISAVVAITIINLEKERKGSSPNHF